MVLPSKARDPVRCDRFLVRGSLAHKPMQRGGVCWWTGALGSCVCRNDELRDCRFPPTPHVVPAKAGTQCGAVGFCERATYTQADETWRCLLVDRGAGFLLSQERRAVRLQVPTYPSRRPCESRDPVRCGGFSREGYLHTSRCNVAVLAGGPGRWVPAFAGTTGCEIAAPHLPLTSSLRTQGPSAVQQVSATGPPAHKPMQRGGVGWRTGALGSRLRRNDDQMSCQSTMPSMIVLVRPPTQTASPSMRIMMRASCPTSRPWLTM